jgi:cupin 2 domain-containing protein
MNLFEGYEVPKSGELFETLYDKNGILIERIVSAAKLQKQIYKQPYDEWLVLLKGEAQIRIEEKSIALKMGDTLLIEKEKEHEVLSTAHDTIWLCLHMKGKDA